MDLDLLIPLIPTILATGKSILNDYVIPIFTKKGLKIPDNSEKEMLEMERIKDIDAIINKLKELDKNIQNQNQTQTGDSNIQISNNNGGIVNTSTIIQNNDQKPNNSASDTSASGAERKLLESCRIFGFDGIQEEEMNDHSKLVIQLTDLTKRIKQDRTVKIIAYYGDRLLNSLEEKLLEAIDSGIKVQLLVGQKGVGLLEDVSSLEETTIKREEIIQKFIDEIQKRKNDRNGGSFECRTYKTQVRYAATIIDGTWAWWTPYHTGIKVEKTISFELVKRGDNSFIDLCIRHFNMLWKVATEWKPS
jgi:hypothetical protein